MNHDTDCGNISELQVMGLAHEQIPYSLLGTGLLFSLCCVLGVLPVSPDMLVQARIWDLLDMLRSEDRVAYLFITHDLRLVRRVCDRALAVEQGRLIEFDHKRFLESKMPGSLGELAAAMLPATPSVVI